jgi:hypothetical protein
MKKKMRPSLNIILVNLLLLLRLIPSLYAFRINTTRSKHIEYVKVAARTVLFEPSITQVSAAASQ